MKSNTQIALFRGQKVRKTIHNNEWWFAIEELAKLTVKGGVQFVPPLMLEREADWAGNAPKAL